MSFVTDPLFLALLKTEDAYYECALRQQALETHMRTNGVTLIDALTLSSLQQSQANLFTEFVIKCVSYLPHV